MPVEVNGLLRTGQRLKNVYIDATIMEMSECRSTYKDIEIDDSLSCLDISNSKGEFNKVNIFIN